jgi:hypothetical protein
MNFLRIFGVGAQTQWTEIEMKVVTLAAFASLALAGAAYAQAPAGTVEPTAPVGPGPAATGTVGRTPGSTGSAPGATYAPGGTGASQISADPAAGSNAGQPERAVPQGGTGSGNSR